MGLLDVFRRKPRALAPAPAVADAALAPSGGNALRLLDGLANVVAGLNTDRDKRYYSAYLPIYRLTQQQLDFMYEGSWLAGKIVDIPAGDMTRQWVSRKGLDDKQAKAVAAAEADLDVPGKMLEALTWERKDGGALIFLAIAGDLDVSQPLDVKRIRKGSLKNLVVMDRWGGQSQEIDNDLGSPNYGLPLYYSPSDSPGTRIHWTRVVRLGGSLIPKTARLNNSRWGGSVLQKVTEAIANYDASQSVAGSMLFEAVVDVLKIGGLYRNLSQSGGESALAARLQAALLLKGVNRTLVIDKDEDYEQKTMDFGGVDKIIGAFAQAVCGAADIPMTRVFGESAGGLNATGKGELNDYENKIKADQRRQLLRPLKRIDQVLLPSVLGSMPPDYDIEANPLRQMTDAEQADLENKRADRDKKYYDMGVLTAGAIARELNQEGTYHTMTEEDVALAEEADDARADARENAAAAFGGGTGGSNGPEDDGPGGGGNTPSDDDEAETEGGPEPAKDSVPGDKIEHKADGWHAYAGGKHIGGPYKTRGKAMRALRRHEKYDRR